MTRQQRLSRALVAVAGALVVSLAVGYPLALSGQQAPPPITGTATELEAYRLYGQNKLLKARTVAEKALKKNERSILGHYVLGCVLREAEGSLGAAMYHLGTAREIYEKRYGTSRAPGAPWGLHREILYTTQLVAGEIEEYEYQLQILDYYDSLYDPALTAEHAWPLLHLRRFAEARKVAKRAIALDDDWQKSLGLNALCAIEGEARTREPHYRACMDALEHARRNAGAPTTDTNPTRDQQLAVHAYNATLAAMSALRFDEAQRLAEEGARRLEFTVANPHRLLARMALDEGDLDDAVRAVREMARWRLRQPANLREQDRADSDATLATVLLGAGELDVALRVVTRALERPDRRGLTSAKPEQAIGGHALLRRAILRAGAELVRERRSREGLLARIGGVFEAAWTRWQAWSDEERVRNVLADDDRLVATLQLYVHGGIEPVPTWLVPDLIDVLGPGVVEVALTTARKDEKKTPALKPYYDAIESELALADGDSARALRLAKKALETLPAREVMLKGRLAVIAARAAEEEGDAREMNGFFERAMQLDPGALRRMGVALPATFRASGGQVASDAADILARSPRFTDDDHGFVVTVRGNDRTLNACLNTPLRAVIRCVDITRDRKKETVEAFVARLSEELHEQTFRLRGTMTTVDLQSLDGSNTGAREATRDQMRDVLRDLAQDPQAN